MSVEQLIFLAVFFFLALFTTLEYLDHELINFNVIFSKGEETFLIKANIPFEVKRVTTFPASVVSLTIHDGYLYVAESTGQRKRSSIWRCKLKYIKDYNYLTIFSSRYKIGWTRFINTCCEISSMVVRKSYAFVACTDGSIRRYTAGNPNDTIVIGKYHFPITGLDYNCADKHLYASLKYGTILRCSPKRTKSCRKIHKFEDDEIKIVKFEFGALWIATKKATLWKCSVLGNLTLDCFIFQKFRVFDGEIDFIGARHGLFYVNVDLEDHISHCSPEVLKSCMASIRKPDVKMEHIAMEHKKSFEERFNEIKESLINLMCDPYCTV